jgi:hypothetical protein
MYEVCVYYVVYVWCVGCACVCMCVMYVCIVWCVYVCVVWESTHTCGHLNTSIHMYTQRPEFDIVFFNHPHLTFWDRASHGPWNSLIQLNWYQKAPGIDSPVPSIPVFSMVQELKHRSSRLHDRHFTDWAISPTCHLLRIITSSFPSWHPWSWTSKLGYWCQLQSLCSADVSVGWSRKGCCSIATASQVSLPKPKLFEGKALLIYKSTQGWDVWLQQLVWCEVPELCWWIWPQSGQSRKPPLDTMYLQITTTSQERSSIQLV